MPFIVVSLIIFPNKLHTQQHQGLLLLLTKILISHIWALTFNAEKPPSLHKPDYTTVFMLHTLK